MLQVCFLSLRFAGLLLLVLVATLLLSKRAPAQAAPTQNAPGGGAQIPAPAQGQLTQLQTTLQSAIAARDAHTAAKTFNQIAELWMRVGNQQNALEAYNHALAAAKLAKD